MAQYKISINLKGLTKAALEKVLTAAYPTETYDQSPFYIQKVEPATSRSARFSEALGKIEDGLSVMRELQEEMSNWLDTIPENLQGGEKYSQVEEAMYSLEDIVGNVESVEGSDVEFTSMM